MANSSADPQADPKVLSEDVVLQIPDDRADLSGVESDIEAETFVFTPRHRITYSRFQSPNFNPIVKGTSFFSYASEADMNSEFTQQMQKVVKNKTKRAQIDKAVLLFNRSPTSAFDYLVKEKLCSKSPADLANFLLLTAGLDKDLIGKVLGGHAPEEIGILQAYVNLVDFSSLEFDIALRMFLTRFRLPGEAQQIDRLVTAFAQRFYDDNPSLFPDKDTPYVLAYSLIMLNTDYHSPKIPTHRKMTKAQFIRNNREVLATLPEQYLSDMYDRITSEKLETKTDGLEIVYKRLVAFSDSVKINHISPTKQKDLLKNAVGSTNVLKQGTALVKYPRKGRPVQRFFFISESGDRLQWISHKGSRERPRFVLFSQLSDVLIGSTNTENFRRFRVPVERDNLCFSLVLPQRSVDLQAPDRDTRSIWVIYFRDIVKDNFDRKMQGIGKKKLVTMNEDQVGEVWMEMIQRWEYYWDSELGEPRRYQETASSGCGCFGSTDRSPHSRALSNNGHLLETMWRRGIPDEIRKLVWPAAIGNHLKITSEQYKFICKESEELERDSTVVVLTRYKRLLNTLEEVQLETQQLQFLKEKYPVEWEAVIYKTMKTFLLYRPELGYIPGLTHIAAVLHLYLPEFESFLCLSNLTNQFYFPVLFSGKRDQLHIRVQVFDSVFLRELRELKEHFRTLYIESDMFFVEWISTMFTKVLPIPLLSHVWDVFFLDGEVFAIKVAVGILKYFENDLRKKTFDGIMRLLQCVPTNVNEEAFFECVAEVQVDLTQFNRQLREVEVATEKAQLLAPLFNS